MDMMKCHFLLFLILTMPMAGCLGGETSQPDLLYETELESKNETILIIQYELEESLSFIESLQNGWEETNQSLLNAVNTADLAQIEILELQMGWQSANQTLLQFEKEWAAYNSSINEYLLEWSQANGTIVELENNLRDANQTIINLQTGWDATNQTLRSFNLGWDNANATIASFRNGWYVTNQTLQDLQYQWLTMNESLIASMPGLIGSWTNPIFSSDPNRTNLYSCQDNIGWKSADGNNTLNALTNTSQNLYLYTIKAKVANSSDCEWQNFDRLLSAFDNSTEEITTMTVFRDSLNLTTYLAQINNTKERALVYNKDIGITVDDFHEALQSPTTLYNDSGLNVSDVTQMRDTAHVASSNQSPIDFMPYIPAEALPIYYANDGIMMGTAGCNSNHCSLTDGTVGVDGDFYLYPEDTLEMNMTFDTPPQFANLQANLSFIIQEMLMSVPYTMDLVIEVNGQQVGVHSMANAQGDESTIFEVKFSTPILPESGTNHIKFSIDTGTSSVTKYTEKVAYMWDFRLGDQGQDGDRVELSNLSATIDRGVVQNRPVHSTDSFIAQTNENWTITHIVDGILFKYPQREGHYDPDLQDRYVSSICEIAHGLGQTCMEVFWANDQWTGDVVGSVDTPDITPYLDNAARYTDGIIFWALDLNLYDRNLGKYSIRDPWTSGFETAVGFPATVSPQPNYYHRWQLDVPKTCNYTIDWNIETNLGPGKVVHIVKINGFQVSYFDVDEGDHRVYLHNLSRNSNLELEIKLIDGYSSRAYASQFYISDDCGDRLDLGEAAHTTGLSTSTELMYIQFTERMILSRMYDS